MTLTYFYDGQCGLCSHLRQFFETEELRVPVTVLDLDSTPARQLLAECPLDPRREVLATDGEGRWWQGADAWIMAMWSSQRLAEWSLRLAEPDLRPLAQRFVAAISRNRLGISRLLRMTPDAARAEDFQHLPEVPQTCLLPPPVPKKIPGATSGDSHGKKSAASPVGLPRQP